MNSFIALVSLLTLDDGFQKRQFRNSLDIETLSNTLIDHERLTFILVIFCSTVSVSRPGIVR